MSVKLKHSNKTTILIVRDEATIYQAAEIKAGLSKLLKAGAQLTVDVKGVTDCDLTFLQLICAAHRSGMQMKTPPRLELTDHNALEGLLGVALSNTVCNTKDADHCLLNPGKRHE